MRDKGAPQGGSAVGAAVGRQAPKAKHVAAQRNKQIAQHITNYARNPQQHAKALRQLGFTPKQVQAVHRNQVTSTRGIVKNPKGVASSVVGFGSRLGKDLSDAAIYSPAGAYQVGKATYHDVGDTIHGKPTLKRTGRIGKQLGKGVASDFRHPGRHPGNVLLDVWGVAGGLEGIGSRVATKSLKRPLTGTLEKREGNLTARVPASKRAGVAALQRKFGAQGAKAVGKALTEERRVTEAATRAPSEALAHRGKKLTSPQQTALRVVEEGKPVSDRVAFHERQAATAKGASVRMHRQKVLLLKAAERYIAHDDKGAPILKPIAAAATKKEARVLAKLHDAEASIGRVAATRQEQLSALGRLSPEATAGRLHGPGQVIETGAREGGYAAGKARIPYIAETPPRALGAHAGFRGGIPRAPGSVTHEFTGGLLKSGNFRNPTTKLVAESGLEAQRYTTILRFRDRVKSAAHDVPQEGDIPIRPDSMKVKPFPANVKAAMRKQEEGIKLSKEEKQTLSEGHASVHDEVFPKDIDPAEYAQHKDIKWIDPKLLDGLDKAPFRLPRNKTVRTIDTINNAQKMAVLYLKPAYAIPNIAGNVWMNVAQQGPHVLENWWKSRSADLEKKLGPDAAATLDSVMGEGIARSLDTHQGIGAKVVSGAAGTWSKLVDRAFRRAAFMHEASRLGFKGPERLKALLTDETHQEKLVEAAQRAKDAIIDYERMGPAESEIARRAIFFYPWVKGSTRYAGHFLVEHPIQSAALGNLGEYGKDHTGLGATPSYLEGSFSTGHNKLANPAAAAIFQTPAQVYNTLQAGLHGGINQANTPAAFATPALELGRALAFRQDSFGNPIDPKAGALDIAKQSLVDSTPQASLYRRLTDKDKSKRLFPLSKKEALAQIVIGGVAPKTYNPTVLHAQAKKEQRSLMSAHQRVLSDYQTFHGELRQAMRKAGEGRIPSSVAERLNLRQERATNRTRAAGGHRLDSKVAFGADVDLIVHHGWMTAKEADEAKAWAAKAGKNDLRSASRYLTTHYFDRDGLLSKSLKYLRENGSPDLTTPSLP